MRLPTESLRPSAGSLAGAGLAVLAAAYAWLALETGRPWLWSVVVHEEGRTLGETILYPSHLLREAPIAALYGLLAATAVSSSSSGAVGRRVRRLAPWALAGAVALVAAAFALEARTAGTASAWRDLLQHRVREDLAAPGAHWGYHGLSTAWFGIVAPYYARAVRGAAPRGRGWIEPVAWLAFVLLTLVFGVSRDVVLDPRFVGHQAREVLTVATLTLPVTIGVLAWISGRETGDRRRPPSRPPRTSPLRLAGAIGIPVYLGVAALRLDALRYARPGASPARLVAAHLFEHVPDVVLCLLVALAVRGLAPRARRS